jgi:hypothetical protein
MFQSFAFKWVTLYRYTMASAVRLDWFEPDFEPFEGKGFDVVVGLY